MTLTRQKYCKPGTRFIYLLILSFFTLSARSQDDDLINKGYIEKTLHYLASDKLKGRVNFTTEQLEAAEFLANEFKSFGLEPFPGYSNYFIPFQLRMSLAENYKLEWNDQKIPDSLFYYLPSGLKQQPATIDDFMILRADYPVADSILYYNWLNQKNKTIIWMVLPDSVSFLEASSTLVIPPGMPARDILIVAQKEEPQKIKLSFKPLDDASPLYNIVGILPGDSLPEQAIIFSAHYDHVDVGTHGERGQIFNGANDDASGTTAVLALAQYFSKIRNNKRTIIFCLFAGEELGLHGSTAFVRQVKTENIIGVVNIEMIGMTNASGKNSFIVNGGEYSDLPDILKKNLEVEKFPVKILKSDPQRSFQRSDNYPFALAGIPAHTVMCSDDNEPCYHRPCDDAKRIDTKNMTQVIKAIARSAHGLIMGTDTPKRIKM